MTRRLLRALSWGCIGVIVTAALCWFAWPVVGQYVKMAGIVLLCMAAGTVLFWLFGALCLVASWIDNRGKGKG